MHTLQPAAVAPCAARSSAHSWSTPWPCPHGGQHARTPPEYRKNGALGERSTNEEKGDLVESLSEASATQSDSVMNSYPEAASDAITFNLDSEAMGSSPHRHSAQHIAKHTITEPVSRNQDDGEGSGYYVDGEEDNIAEQESSPHRHSSLHISKLSDRLKDEEEIKKKREETKRVANIEKNLLKLPNVDKVYLTAFRGNKSVENVNKNASNCKNNGTFTKICENQRIFMKCVLKYKARRQINDNWLRYYDNVKRGVATVIIN